MGRLRVRSLHRLVGQWWLLYLHLRMPCWLHWWRLWRLLLKLEVRRLADLNKELHRTGEKKVWWSRLGWFVCSQSRSVKYPGQSFESDMLPICLPSRGQHKNPPDSRFGLQWLRLLHLHLRMPCWVRWWRLWRLLCLGRLLLRLQVRRLADLNKELHRTREKKVWWSRLGWFVCSQSRSVKYPGQSFESDMLPICFPSRGQHKNPPDSRFGLQWLRLLHLHLRMPCWLHWWRLWRLLCLGRLLQRLQVRRLADLNKELHRTREKKVWWSRLGWFVRSQSRSVKYPGQSFESDMLPICLPSRGQHKNPPDSRFGLQWLRLLHRHLRMPCWLHWWRLWRLLCLGRLLQRL